MLEEIQETSEHGFLPSLVVSNSLLMTEYSSLQLKRVILCKSQGPMRLIYFLTDDTFPIENINKTIMESSKSIEEAEWFHTGSRKGGETVFFFESSQRA